MAAALEYLVGELLDLVGGFWLFLDAAFHSLFYVMRTNMDQICLTEHFEWSLFDFVRYTGQLQAALVLSFKIKNYVRNHFYVLPLHSSSYS